MSSPERRLAFPPNWWARIGWLVLAAYVVYALGRLDFSWDRFVTGLDNGARFIGRMLPPRIAQGAKAKANARGNADLAVMLTFERIEGIFRLERSLMVRSPTRRAAGMTR